jgi:hypothetical protein
VKTEMRSFLAAAVLDADRRLDYQPFDALVRAIRGEPHEDPDGDEAEDPWGGPAAVDPWDGPPPWDSAPDPWAVADPSSRKTVGGSVVEVEPPF